MTDTTDGISRRKLLGSVATVGGAAALGGAGSVAFFSDREEFANNRLVAGELDLKVDWTEHYSDWSGDETTGIETVSMEPAEGLAGFPSAAPESEQSVFVSDPDQFLRNTAIEAFPDVLDETETYDALQATLEEDGAICDLPADTPEVLEHPFRTRGTFPSGVEGDEVNPQTTAPGDPLIAVEDVKPGDFGELTLSFHVCGNPGYVWLTGALREAAENGLTEAERKDPDEDGDADSTAPEDVELLDEVRAAFWYDTGADGVYGADFADEDAGEGDNYRQDSESVITIGTLGSVLDALEAGPFPLDAEPVSQGTVDPGGEDGTGGAATVIDSLGDGYTLYVTTEDEAFTDSGLPGAGGPRNYNCADYETVFDIDLVGSAVEATQLEANGTPATYGGCAEFTVNTLDQSAGTITLSTAGPVRVVSVKGGNAGENVYLFDEPVVLDTVTFSTPTGQNISNIDVCCPVGDDGNGGGQVNGDRQCFPNSTTAYVGFEWWLPVDHANEIQTDSVSFDLGFYTEQCRHNDGALGNDGAGGGGGQDGDDAGAGDQAISFVAWCTEDGDPAAIDPSYSTLETDDAGDPSSIEWTTDIGVDRVVVFYASRVTVYEYDSPTTTDVATTGDTVDDGGATVTDRAANLPQDANNPCGDLDGVKEQF